MSTATATSTSTTPPYYPTAHLALQNTQSTTPLSNLPNIPHNRYINSPLLILVSPREDLRRQAKTDYYLSSPETWPHRTVLSVWRDRDTFKPLPGTVVKLKGVAVNKQYDEDPEKKILVKRREGLGGKGHLNIYKGHPGGWWEFPSMSEEVGELVEWWEGIVRKERMAREEEEKRVKEEGEAKQRAEQMLEEEGDERKTVKQGAQKERIEPQQERPESRGRLQVEERGRRIRDNIKRDTERLKAEGKIWGKGGWWRIDGLY